ncbi:MAG: AraC family transcriptional regulator [Piscinibacter sp.]|nr:AraC family transcriptional regulator [Piscinibacter sp.]
MSDRGLYIARINRVIDHIDAHLDEPLDLAALAAVAHFSPWHFHRLFQALTGETLADRVRRRRLEVAAGRLLATPAVAALTIALDVGFGSAEVFTRAFKAHFGVTPSAWRRGAWHEHAQRHRAQLRKIHQDRRKAHQAVIEAFAEDRIAWPEVGHGDPQGASTMKIELKTLPDIHVAYLRHVGPYGDPGISQLWQRFDRWCAQRGLAGPGRLLLGVSQDSPDITAPDRCRYDACVEVDAGFRPEGEVGVQALAGGRYACARYRGTALQIHEAWMAMFGRWLPDSGYLADDRPCLELYDDGAGVDPKTGAFSCLLCVPLKAA